MTDDLKGKGRHLGGKIKEEVGELLGDREMETEGRLSQAEGIAEQDAARAEEDLRNATSRMMRAEEARKRSKRRPLP
jgi:uncharacterized protein YjbJ (UPF0337 family)